MKKLLLVALIATSFTLSAQEPAKILYVAIKSGLNMRESPDVVAKVIEKIPYATKITLLDNNEAMITIRTEGLIGYWRKVKYNNKTGYIVDSYLFSQPPPKATVKTMKDYLAQLSVPFGNKLTVKNGDDESGTTLTKQLYKNGSEWHTYQGIEFGSNTYFIPDFTMQEAFLLIRMIPEFAEVINSKDEFPRENKMIKKGDVEYRIKVETEMYTEDPWIKKITIEYEPGGVYSFDLYQVDNQIVIFYGGGV